MLTTKNIVITKLSTRKPQKTTNSSESSQTPILKFKGSILSPKKKKKKTEQSNVKNIEHNVTKTEPFLPKNLPKAPEHKAPINGEKSRIQNILSKAFFTKGYSIIYGSLKSIYK